MTRYGSFLPRPPPRFCGALGKGEGAALRVPDKRISAQPTALYKEAATLCVTDSLTSASKVNISTEPLITYRKRTTISKVKETEISHSVCRRDGAQTTHALTRSARAPTIYIPAYYRQDAPETAEPWQDVYDATKFGPSCYQPHMFDVWMMAQQPNRSFGSASVQQGGQQPWLYLVQDYLLDVSEDCLSLNVYTPFVKNKISTEVNGGKAAEGKDDLNSDWLSAEDLNRSSANAGSSSTSRYEFTSESFDNSAPMQVPLRTRLSVMVYIHGGSYFGNAGRLYPGEKLASTGMVVVTLNYRLGAFGEWPAWCFVNYCGNSKKC
ncbi:Carboxylesterase type B [Trinorchestia longiramus]|nr:Carboxylesterase type B [Trinorchestia longiramus]